MGQSDRMSGARLRLEARRITRRGHRSGAGCGAAEAAVLGVIEAAARGLEMTLRLFQLGAWPVIDQGVQARQAGTCRQEEHQEE